MMPCKQHEGRRNTVALVLAGGSGTRVNAALPKQYITVAGKPILAHTLAVFQQHTEIDVIAVVCAADRAAQVAAIGREFGVGKLAPPVSGGATRQESARLGLAALRPFVCDDAVVLIHDAARPLLPPGVLSANIALARRYGGVTTAVAAADTMLQSGDQKTVSHILSRDGLYSVQTPQSFLYGGILAAHEAARQEGAEAFTDDCGLYMRYTGGKPVAIAPGSRFNFKITTDEDLELFRALAGDVQ